MAGGEDLVTQDTHINGVGLRVVKGAVVEVTKEAARRLYDLALRYFKNEAVIKRIERRQADLKERLLELIRGHGEQVRGVRSEPDNFLLSFARRVKTVWDRALLRQGLGSFYPNAVREQLIVSIAVPVQSDVSARDIVSALRKVLIEHGIPTAQVNRFLKTEFKLLVDASRVEELEQEKKVALPVGARNDEDVVWAFTPKPLFEAVSMSKEVRVA